MEEHLWIFVKNHEMETIQQDVNKLLWQKLNS